MTDCPKKILIGALQHIKSCGLAGVGPLIRMAGLLFMATSAHAEFKACNQTLNLYNIAIGYEANHVFQTEGWWTLPANGCVSVIKDDLALLKIRYVYVHALSVLGEDALSGEWDMCIGSHRFQIPKIQGEPWNCWARGYQQAKFKEIDTGNAKDWTIFIRDGEK